MTVEPLVGSPLLVAAAGPVTFLVILGVFSVAVARHGADGRPDPEAIAEQVTGRMATILLIVQAALTLAALLLWRRGAVAFTSGPRPVDQLTAVLVGGATGTAIFVVYVGGIERLMIRIQQRLGDYVPTGAVVDRLARPLTVFFVANVVLAPVAEEVLYRGYLIPRLAADVGTWPAVVLSSLAFGVLHWPGGLWYMAATALFVGLPLGGLYVVTGSLAAPLAAHLLLNVLEFGLGLRRARSIGPGSVPVEPGRDPSAR